jgi:signal peptidase I
MKTFLRLAFWTIWFFILPTLLAGALVWVLTPAEGAVPTGLFGHLQTIVGDQRVPAAIVFFTLFVSVLWSQRYVLPLAGLAIGGRQDVPLAARKHLESAFALLDEAGRIQRRHHKAIDKKLSEEDLKALNSVLDELRERINEEKFDVEAFEEALQQAQDAVDTWLGPWRKGEVREYGESIAIAIVVALLLRSFVIEAFKIPSRSMVPTLEVGDHIFVNKFSYGPLIPFTSKRLFENLPPKR